MENNIIAENATSAAQIELVEQKFRDTSIVLAILISGISLWIMIYALWEHFHRPFPVEYMIQGVDLVGFIMFLFALRHTSFSLKELVLYNGNPRKVIRQTIVLSIVAFLSLALFKYVAQLYDPSLFSTEHGFFDIRRFNLYQVFYLFTSLTQEFIARSVMQYNLKRVCATSHKATYAIILSSLIFAILHIECGILYMVGAAILGGILGIIYEKQHTLLGVWLIHWFLGVSAFLFGIIDR